MRILGDILIENAKKIKDLKQRTEYCPICNGNGIVDKGFYSQTSGQWYGSGGFEKCRSCDGNGYVLVSDVKGRKE